MNTDDALLFVRVAESLSFKDAAAQLGISRSAASKRIALLEKELGVTLINRNPRSISLTHAGAVVLEQSRTICNTVAELHQALHGHGLQPVGALQVAIPTTLGAALLPALLTEFVPNYPKLTLSVHLVDGDVDIVGSGFDVALVLARRLEDSGLTARRLATSRQVLVASPDYLVRHGVPRDIKDLLRHRCLDIGYARKKVAAWRFSDQDRFVDIEVPLAMTANSYLVLNLAACFDMGLIYVPEIYVASDVERGRLRFVLPECTKSIDWGLYAVYANRKASENVSAFIEFVRARIGYLEKRDRWMPLARQSAL
jgi:DNA-binding transcriptional LysR family regulator